MANEDNSTSSEPQAVQEQSSAPPPPEPVSDMGGDKKDTVVVSVDNNQQKDSQDQAGVVVPPAGSGDQGEGGGSKKRGFPIKILLIIIVLIALVAGGSVAMRFVQGLASTTKETTITYWGLWEDETIIQPIIDDFEAKNSKIKVNYQKQSHRQYRERLTSFIDQGEGPDVFRFHNTWVPMLKEHLTPVPRETMSASEFTSTFYPTAKNDLVAGSTIYGIPLMIDGLGLYINEDIFAAAGVTAPETWEDVLGLVPQLTVKDDLGNILTSAIALGNTENVENFSDLLAVMMLQNGANLTDLASKEAQDALMFYKKFSDSSDPVYTWNETLDNSIFAFANGKVAMILAPSWRAFDIEEISPDLKYRIAPIPQLPGANVTWSSYWVEGVSSKSDNQDQAWTFVKYLTSRETAVKLFEQQSKVRLFGEPYARVDLASTIKSDPYVGAYVTQAPDGTSFPLASRTHDNGINDKLIKYLKDAVNSIDEGSSPLEALETAQKGFEQVFGQYGMTTRSAP